MSEEPRFDSPDDGLGVTFARGRTDSAVADLAFRVREVWRLFTAKSGEVCPDGSWMKDVDTPTRKVWDGYHRRVHLETERSPGGGWRVWVKTPGSGVQYPVRVSHITTNRWGEVERNDYLEVRDASEPEDVPTFPRSESFTAAELFMSAFAMERPDIVDREVGPDE
jgi:hypothetical protein